MVKLALNAASNMNSFPLSNIWCKWSKCKKYGSLNDSISSEPLTQSILLCSSFVSLPLFPSIKLNHISFTSPSSSHYETSQIEMNWAMSVSLCLICWSVPVYATCYRYTVRKTKGHTMLMLRCICTYIYIVYTTLYLIDIIL